MKTRTKQKMFLLIFSLFIGYIGRTQNNCKEVVGYYPNWQWYDRSKLVNPQTIDYSKYSILNYCFFAPQPDGSINSTDAWADENLLLGQPDWANGGYIPNTSIVDNAHNNSVKVLPSIGGWTLSGNFPSIAADPVKRANFAQACVTLIQTYNFDGIDIDWEYPGYLPHGGTAADIINYTLLLQEIRTEIDAYGVTVGKTMILTAAVGAAEDKMDDVNWTDVSQLLDIINLMSYDFFGSWDSVTNHNSPLYAPAQGDPTFNLDHAVDKLINFYNVDPNKITLGVGFYGRSMKTAGPSGLHVPTTGAVDDATFSADEGSPLYYNVLLQMNQFTVNWDNTAEVPYLTDNNGINTFVSYDDEQSIGLKAQYIIDKGLRGAIIWEITGDYIETSPGSGIISGTPLADTLNNVFCNNMNGSLPNVTIQGNITICEGEEVELTANGADTYLWGTGETTESILVTPTTTTTFTVTGSNTNGSDQESITVTVHPTPATPSINSNGNLLECSVNAVSYQWYLEGVVLPNATSQSYQPTQNGNYTVMMVDVNGCSALSGDLYWEMLNLTSNQFGLNYYPNPVHNDLILEFNSVTNINLKVLSITGSLVENLGQFSEQQIKLDFSSYEAGIYFVSLYHATQGTVFFKIVVEK